MLNLLIYVFEDKLIYYDNIHLLSKLFGLILFYYTFFSGLLTLILVVIIVLILIKIKSKNYYLIMLCLSINIVYLILYYENMKNILPSILEG